MSDSILPPEGSQVEFWRRDKGGKSERITAMVLETIEPVWCVIQRDDTGETRTIDPKRLRVIKMPPGPVEPLVCLQPGICNRDNRCENCVIEGRYADFETR